MKLDRTKAPEIKQFPEVHLDFPEAETLENGLKYYVVDCGDIEVCQIDVYVGGGCMEQPKCGLVNFVTKVLTKGSKGYSSEEIAEAFDFYGSVLSASVFTHRQGISIKSINKNFKEVLPIFFDCLCNPTFPQKELDINREKYLADNAIRRRQVSFMAVEKMTEMCYGKGHPLGLGIDEDVVKGITTEDLKDFHRKHYAPGNCTVVLSGRITDEVMETFKAVFGQWEPSKCDERTVWYCEPQDTMCEIVHKEDAVQTAVEIFIDAIPRGHEDYIKLRILIIALGGYFGSRLMMNIREDKGYTYGINSYLQGRKEVGRIGISTECGSQYTGGVLREVRNEMARLKTELIPEGELQVIKNHILSDLVKTLDNAFSIAGYVGLVYGCDVNPEYFNEQIRQVKEVTSEELMDMARKYLREDKMRIVLAGDKNKMKLEE